MISVFSDADKLAKLFKLLIAENDAIGIGIKRIPTPIINPALDAADPTQTRPATAADSPYTSLQHTGSLAQYANIFVPVIPCPVET